MKTVFILILLVIAVAATANTFECEEKGEFQDPDDCTSFIICDENKTASSPIKCGPGLNFDDEKKVCNWPGQVKCKNAKTD